MRKEIIILFVNFLSVLGLSFGQNVVRLGGDQLKNSIEINFPDAHNNSLIINEFLSKYRGNEVILPEGEFVIGSAVIIPAETILKGSEHGTIIWIHKEFSKDIAYFLNESFNLGSPKSDNGVVIQNLTINGQLHASQAGETMGIFFNKVNNSAIRDIILNSIANEAIRIHSSMSNTFSQKNIVERCIIEKRGYKSKGIMISSYTIDPINALKSPAVVNDFIVRGCSIFGSDHGIILFNVKNGLIEGNKCIANISRGIILSPTVSNVKIIANTVDSAGSTGIHLAYGANNIVIESNNVTNTLKDMSGKGFEGQGIKAYIGFSDLKILYNNCSHNATDGIALEGGGDGYNFLISGNVLENNKRNGIRIWAGGLSTNKGGDITLGTIEINKIIGNVEAPIFIGSDNKGINRVRKTNVLGNNVLKPLKGRIKIKQEYWDRSN